MSNWCQKCEARIPDSEDYCLDCWALIYGDPDLSDPEEDAE